MLCLCCGAAVCASTLCTYASVVCYCVLASSEAHPTDEWKLYTDICYEQPKTLADRMDKARLYLDVSKTQVPITVDTMDNLAESAYAARCVQARGMQCKAVATVAAPSAPQVVSHSAAPRVFLAYPAPSACTFC